MHRIAWRSPLASMTATPNPDLPGQLPHPASLALARRLAAGADSVEVRAVSLYGGDLESTCSLDGFTVAAGPLLRTCGG